MRQLANKLIHNKLFWAGLVIIALIVLLSISVKKPNSPKSFTRYVKIQTVHKMTSERTRRFSGIVQPLQNLTISFQVPGLINFIQTKFGAKIKKNQLLASLDPTIFQLEVHAAEAKLRQANANLSEMKYRYEASAKLVKQRHISIIEFKKIESAYQNSLEQIKLATAKLNIAKTRLDKTKIYAPFSGSIIKTYVENHTEVRAGQTIMRLQGQQGFEVEVNIPGHLIHQLKLNQKVKIKFINLNKQMATGTIIEIGTSISGANVYPVVIKVNNPPKLIRAGMIVETILTLPLANKLVYLIPINAVIPADKVGEVYIFLYDPKTQTVHRHKLKVSSVQTNFLVIT
ncbi:MAG: efflux RND transporter periplasmic adaptor subunit [Gammaproteobacteria bacterium]|nr:efflux RND transporter periplasmic adaptor subunit [Gammaproteobacteria bacterium]